MQSRICLSEKGKKVGRLAYRLHVRACSEEESLDGQGRLVKKSASAGGVTLAGRSGASEVYDRGRDESKAWRSGNFLLRQ